MNINFILFPQNQLDKPGPVLQDRYKVDRVIEYRKATGTGMPQYKVRWFASSLENDHWIYAKDISTGIVQEFWTKESLENTYKKRHINNGQADRYQRDKALTVIQNKGVLVMSLHAEEEEISTYSNNITLQIFHLFLQY